MHVAGCLTTPAQILRRARRIGRVDASCLLAAAVLVFAVKLAVAAAAWAELPDGRVYEQVSSQKKNGNEAGVILKLEAGGVTTRADTA